MLIVVYGGLGSGKTLLLTTIAKYTKKKVVANFHLNTPYEEFSLSSFVNAEYENCILLLDEAYVYLESRLAMSKVNRASSYILFQSRKKNVELYLTVQMIGTLDVRFRNLTDLWIYCEGMTRNGFKYTLIDNTTGSYRVSFLPIHNAENIYEEYDTNEIIKPMINSNEFMDMSEQKDLIYQRVNEIRSYYGNIKITKAMIKKYYFEQEYTFSNSIIDMVYVYLKEQEDSGEIDVKNHTRNRRKASRKKKK